MEPPEDAAGRGSIVVTGARRSLTVLVACASVGVVMADSIVGTMCVVMITGDRRFAGTSLIDLQWLVTAAAIPYAAVLAVGGRLADTLGRRRILLAGLTLFTLGAMAAITAESLPVLLAARVVQGAGAGLAVPASLGLVLACTPAQRRPVAVGVWSAASGLGGLAIQVGGVWLTALGWRALMAPALIMGAATLLMALLLPSSPPRGAARPGAPDLAGMMLLMAGVGGLVLALTKASAWGWKSPAVLALLLGAVAAVAGTGWRSRRHLAPAVDMDLWRRRRFALSGLISMAYGMVAFALLTTAPLLLRHEWQVPAPMVSLALAPLSAGVLVASVMAGPVIRRRGARASIYAGSVLIIGALVWLLYVGLGTQPQLAPVWLPVMALIGLGLGAVSTGASAMAALVAGADRSASAVGAGMAVRQVGSAIGASGAVVLVELPVLEGPLPGYSLVMAAIMVVTAVAGFAALAIRPARSPAPGRVDEVRPVVAHVFAEGELRVLERASEQLIHALDEVLAIAHRQYRPPRR